MPIQVTKAELFCSPVINSSMNALLLFSFLCLCSPESQESPYPDGTVVFSSSIGLIGRIAHRLTDNDKYTHIGVVIDGVVYESDWPKIRTTEIEKYGKAKSTNDYYVPKVPFTKEQVDKMREYAKSQLGKPYQLKNYFYPKSKPTKGTWCSVYAGRILNASGRYKLTPGDIFEPQRIKEKIDDDYELRTIVIRRR